MRTFVQIRDGIVVNRALFGDAGLPADWPDAASFVESATADIGDRYDGAVFTSTKPPPPPPPPAPTLDEIYDQAMLTQRVLKAIVLALNDGTLTVGGLKTAAQLKAIIKAKM